jgi:hypothetical protein
MTYNGWTNYETWSLVTWLSSYEQTERQFQEFLDLIEKLAKKDEISLSKVNFNEIIKSELLEREEWRIKVERDKALLV